MHVPAQRDPAVCITAQASLPPMHIVLQESRQQAASRRTLASATRAHASLGRDALARKTKQGRGSGIEFGGAASS